MPGILGDVTSLVGQNKINISSVEMMEKTKTSINFKGSKNQIGNFYPPSKIFVDTNFLKTLKTHRILLKYEIVCRKEYLCNACDTPFLAF